MNQKQAVVSILDNEPTLRVEIVDGVGRETLPQAGETNNMVFRVHRSGVSNVPVKFGFGFSGTSLRGFNGSGDYALEIDGVPASTSVTQWTMPAGTDVAEFRLIPVNDGLMEASETVIFDLRAGTTYSLIADTAQRRGQALIHDLAEPVVKVEVTDAAISERNPTTTGKGQFKFTREGGDLSQPVTIRYTLGGTATMDVDYTGLTGEVTIPAGLRTALVDLIPVDDLVTEGTETATLTLLEDAGYRIKPAQKTLSVNITDWETAPDNLNGLYVQMSIIGGTAPFAKSGSQRLMTGSSENIYATTNFSTTPGVPSSGTFTFDKITNDKAVMEISDDTLGNLRGELTFSSAAAAKYEFYAGNDLIQSGYMSMTRNTNWFGTPILGGLMDDVLYSITPNYYTWLQPGILPGIPPGIPLTGETTSVTTIGGLGQPYQAGVINGGFGLLSQSNIDEIMIALEGIDYDVTIDYSLIADGILTIDELMIALNNHPLSLAEGG
ncbi:MAG: hypothetical protein HC898_07850 [Phycisphaerales bacterium]|nr:hypothetical protein [Phycisphaerales bacterium]